jgi:hypothetical protein
MDIEDTDLEIAENPEKVAAIEPDIDTVETEDERNIYFWLSISFFAIFILSYFIL